METVCAPPHPVAASANNGAGYINYCIYYPRVVLPATTFTVSSTMTAPTTVLGGFNTAATAFTAVSGCTEGTPAQVVPTTNGVVGTMVSFVSSFTMTGEQCDFSTLINLQIAAAPIQVYAMGLVGNVRTENVRVDNYNFLCAATGGVPNAFSTTATTCTAPAFTSTNTNSNDNLNRLCAASTIGSACTTPTINAALSGSVALTGTLSISQSGAWTITDDANGWAVHQDPLSGTITVNGIPDTQSEIQAVADAILTLNRLRVQLCGDVGDVETGACNPLNANLSGSVDTNLTVDMSMGGNNTFTFPDSLNIDVEHSGGNPGLGLWLPLLFWIAALLFFWYINSPFGLGFATVGLFDAIAPSGIPGDFTTYLAFCILAATLEYFAGERLRSAWRDRKRLK